MEPKTNIEIINVAIEQTIIKPLAKTQQGTLN